MQKEESRIKHEHLLLMSALIQLALFVPVTVWGRKHQYSLREIKISRHLQKKRPSLLRRLVLLTNSITGSATAVNLLAVPIAFFLWKRQLRLEALVTIVMCWTGELVRQGIKKLVDRPRPNSLLVHVTTHPKGKSFPSGDVASSVCLWGWLLALGWRSRQKHRAGKGSFLGIPAAWIMFIGPARIYLGAHWMTDVIGGYLFGGGWLSLTLYFYSHWIKQYVPTAQGSAST